MSELTLLLSLLIAFLVPRLALSYLRPILLETLQRMCETAHAPSLAVVNASPDASGTPLPGPVAIDPATAATARSGAEFWWRVLNVLAISGSLLLVLSFGYRDGFAVSLHDFLRRTLLLVTTGVFVSVAYVAWRVQAQLRMENTVRERRLAPAAARSATAAAGAAARPV